MIPGKVSCLMATYGRYARVCEALACFLAQDYDNRELVILNNHPTPLRGAFPRVRIINEPLYSTLGHCRNRLLDFADGEFLRIWDDDDLYLPWTIGQGVARIGLAPAWKPARSWWFDGSGMGSGVKRQPVFELASNSMEASILWRTDFVRRVGWRHGEGDESKPLLAALGGTPAQTDLGEWASYCYRWGIGEWHASGTVDNGQADDVRAADWKSHNSDVRPQMRLVPAAADVRQWFARLARFIRGPLQTPWLLAALGAGPAHVSALEFQPAKIMASDAAARKFRGRRIIVAPGCWDVLHPGHVGTLETAGHHAGSEGRVIALVNNDDGVRAQKGVDRPLLPLGTRAGALSSLDCVDAVVAVAGADDHDVIELIRPAAIIKGPEYSGRKVRNADLVNELLIAPPSTFAKHTSSLCAN